MLKKIGIVCVLSIAVMSGVAFASTYMINFYMPLVTIDGQRNPGVENAIRGCNKNSLCYSKLLQCLYHGDEAEIAQCISQGRKNNTLAEKNNIFVLPYPYNSTLPTS